MDIKVDLFYKLFYKKVSGSSVKIKIMPNQLLAEELHKLIIRKSERRKVYF